MILILSELLVIVVYVFLSLNDVVYKVMTIMTLF